ncbi:HAD hydrolase-like protein [Lysinibacter sp. HNR]|uniref:HAD hydrolase-like protein n=1 Tax=Lysinibacter sp. HNR TaxID=3031408 RepID=UPI00243566E7|nr:HAD hydrolase-like protein [Lysinibacter sp. HNR]WGD37391.1 HAD hydrolase-like protein [Lysinibacter sp. HNR]
MLEMPPSSLVANPLPLPADVVGRLHTKTKPWTTILWDLDGTITDSAPGIVKRIGDALVQVGLPRPSQEELYAMVGPPLLDTFIHTVGMSEELANKALQIQRDIALREGPDAGSSVYPGVPEMLRELHSAGIPVGLATSKGEVQAIEILEHFGLTPYFTAITGSSPDETRSAKADVVAETLRRLSAAGADISNPVMVGDRIFDVNGAAEHDIPTIIVEWGYGSAEENADAIAHVSSIDQLRPLLLP